MNRAIFFHETANSVTTAVSRPFLVFVLANNMSGKQNVDIFKWFPVFILLPLWCSKGECFFLSKQLLLAAVENPLQAQLHCPQMNDSSHMRSMKHSVYIPAPPTCLMIQSHDKLATSSSKLSSPLRFLDVRSHVRSMPSTHETGRSFLRVCTQKCDPWGDSSSGMS